VIFSLEHLRSRVFWGLSSYWLSLVPLRRHITISTITRMVEVMPRPWPQVTFSPAVSVTSRVWAQPDHGHGSHLSLSRSATLPCWPRFSGKLSYWPIEIRSRPGYRHGQIATILGSFLIDPELRSRTDYGYGLTGSCPVLPHLQGYLRWPFRL
jgi:hypothetical protein